jgi:hypothetical protein
MRSTDSSGCILAQPRPCFGSKKSHYSCPCNREAGIFEQKRFSIMCCRRSTAASTRCQAPESGEEIAQILRSQRIRNATGRRSPHVLTEQHRAAEEGNARPDRAGLAACPEAVDCSHPRHPEAGAPGREHRRSCRRAHARRSTRDRECRLKNRGARGSVPRKPGEIERALTQTQQTIWKSKEVVHNHPEKDRPIGLPARCASIPCSK